MFKNLTRKKDVNAFKYFYEKFLLNVVAFIKDIE